MYDSKIRHYREKLGYTQAELAEKTQLSIRTIQRLEAGKTTPHQYTLQTLATALEVSKVDLQPEPDNKKAANAVDDTPLKLINLSALSFLGIPFGNIIVPFFLWRRYKADPRIYTIGKKILSVQILWSLCTMLLLIVSPFLQIFFPENITLILWVGLAAILINIYLIFKISHLLSRGKYDFLPVRLELL